MQEAVEEIEKTFTSRTDLAGECPLFDYMSSWAQSYYLYPGIQYKVSPEHNRRYAALKGHSDMPQPQSTKNKIVCRAHQPSVPQLYLRELFDLL